MLFKQPYLFGSKITLDFVSKEALMNLIETNL